MAVHSSLGASGAERWLNCPGSHTLLKSLHLPPDTSEASWRRDGHIAHEGASICLQENLDCWEIIGRRMEDGEFTLEHSKGAQVYVDIVRADFPWSTDIKIEEPIWDKTIHRLFGGTVDCAVLRDEWLIVNDYKNGVGVVVEIVENPQLMYYAAGILRRLPAAVRAKIKNVRLRIVQPNSFEAKAEKTWDTTPEHIEQWLTDVLVPGMIRAERDTTLALGSWCQFCPARLICPAQRGIFAAVAQADAGQVTELKDAELDLAYTLLDANRFYRNAVEKEIYRRLMEGKWTAGAKLVDTKSDRVWKDGAEAALKTALGDAVYTEPKLRTPADAENVSGEAKKLVKEWAFTPHKGYAVAFATDKRAARKPETATDVFGAAAAKLTEGTNT